MAEKKVVVLVDDRRRDLMVTSLLALQLRNRGIRCVLEPLEAYQGVLAADRPDMIVFNHVAASHLVKYTRRLAKMGVMTAVMPNEGLCYDDEERAFIAQRHHQQAHLDLFFCWNNSFAAALRQTGFRDIRIEVVGNQRFDFFFSPWAEAFQEYARPENGKPVVLFCTNFGLAEFHELPSSEMDKFFSSWKDRISSLRDYRGIVEAQHRYRQKALKYLEALLACGRYNVILRPHPRERLPFYGRWIDGLPHDSRDLLRVEHEVNIATLMLACDLAIACENCNTSMDAWVAGRPSLELIFEKHPALFSEDVGRLNPHCEDPSELPSAVSRELRDPAQKDYTEGRRQHLAKWCQTPSGQTTACIAELIAETLKKKPAFDWSQLTLADRRRGLKLKLLRKLDKPYHFNPFLQLNAMLDARYRTKLKAYDKSIRPSDVKRARQQLEDCVKRSKNQIS